MSLGKFLFCFLISIHAFAYQPEVSGSVVVTNSAANPVKVEMVSGSITATVSGSSTAAKQDLAYSKLASMDATLISLNGKVTAVNTTGAATSAKQDSQATLLGAIESYLADMLSSISSPGAANPTYTQSVAGTDGSFLRSLKTDSNGELQIDVLSLPVASVSQVGIFRVEVSGTQTVVVSGVATETTLSAMSAKLPSSLGIKTAANSISTAPASDAIYRTEVSGTPIVSGSVDVRNFPSTYPVTGAFWQATQPISAVALPLAPLAATSTIQLSTDNTLNSLNLKIPALGQALAAASTPVVLTASQLSTLTPLSSVTANIGTTNGLALDATVTTMSGKLPASLGAKTGATSFSVVPATDASFGVQMVSSTGTITTQNLAPTGTATAGSAVELSLSGQQVASIAVTGTYTGALSVQYSGDGPSAVWVLLNDGNIKDLNGGLYNFSIASGLTGIWAIPVYGKKVRITALAAVTGTATITIAASSGILAPANQNININLVGGATAAVNSGAADAGTLRVILATNNPTMIVSGTALDTIAARTPALGAATMANSSPVTISSNQAAYLVSSDITKIGGVALAVNNGTASTGAQRVVVASDNTPYGILVTPTSAATTALTTYISPNLEPHKAIKASAGRLYSVCVNNTKATSQTIQVWNSTTVPANGVSATTTWDVPASATSCMDLGPMGEYFSTGISIGNSTTQIAHTSGVSDTIFKVYYQ